VIPEIKQLKIIISNIYYMPKFTKGSPEAIDHMNKIRGKAFVKGSEEAKQHMKELRDKRKKKT
jgi:hypothetical protein